MRNTSPTHRTLHCSIPILYLLPLLLSSHLPPLWSLCLVGLGGSRDGGALMCASCTSPNLTKIKWATAPCCTHWCRITKWRVIKGCDALSASASWVPLSNESPAIFSYHTFLPPLPANLPLTILLQFHFMRCWSSFWRLFFATICSCVVVYHFGGCSFYHCSSHDSFTLIFLLNYYFKHLNFGGCLLPLFLIFFSNRMSTKADLASKNWRPCCWAHRLPKFPTMLCRSYSCYVLGGSQKILTPWLNIY